MATFAELLRFELKKIFQNRITILALALSAGMLLGIAVINYIVINPYDRNVYDREAALEGRPLDDALMAKLAALVTHRRLDIAANQKCRQHLHAR